MNEDASTVAALQEIAALLRRRVEQQDDVARTQKEMYERAAQMNKENRIQAEMSKSREDFRKQNEERTKQHEERVEEQKREKEKLDSETRDFREKLLAEFTLHNRLLERIITQLKK